MEFDDVKSKTQPYQYSVLVFDGKVLIYCIESSKSVDLFHMKRQ